MPASWQPSTTAATWTTAPPKTTWPTLRWSVSWHRDTPGLRLWRMTKSTDADRQQPGSDWDRTHSTCAQCCWRRRRRHQRASSRVEGRQTAESDPAAKKGAYNTTMESVLADRGVTSNTCVSVLCLQAHPQSDHRQQQATAKQEQDQRQSADQVGHSSSFQFNSPFEPQNPFTCEFLGNYQSVASKASEWEQQLKDDPDKAFLLAGIKNGFRITKKGCKIAEAEAKNHKSATLHSRRTLVEKELKTQIEQGNYVTASKKPAIISTLGAIPKDDWSVRLIHDGSLPGFFLVMNEYTDHHSVRYQTLQDACRLAEPGYYCAKLDLQSAYRSVPIHLTITKPQG